MDNLELELHRLRVHYAANRLNEEGVPFDRSFNQFDHIISLVEAAAKQREEVRALRGAADDLRVDIAFAWNRHRGVIFQENESDPGVTPEEWLDRRADRITKQENNQ